MADPTITVRGRSDLGALNRGLDQASGKVSSFASKARRALGVGLAIAGAAAVKFGVDSVQAASAAQQSIGATETVFGRYARTVIRESDRAAQRMGLSANEYRELANTAGAMLQNAGIPLRKTADLTAKLNQRAADVAATFGGPTSDAMQAFTALLRGETDPIERYGVSIKESDIQARLAAKGLDKLTGSALNQAKQQERLALLFEQTEKSAGQFRRESGTLAGQQARLSASFENMQAKIGKLLLPMFTSLADYANRKVVPALERFADWVETNKDEIGKFAGSVRDAVLPPLEVLADAVQKAAEFFSSLPSPVQKSTIQLGLAAVAIAKLNTALNAAQVPGFVRSLSNAEGRTAAFARTVKLAAGAGGILLLVEGLSRLDSELGPVLTMLGGAATGLAVGGPLGLAVGGVAGLLGGLALQTGRASDSMNLGQDAAKNYAATLDQVSGAARGATRETAALALQQAGAFDKAAMLGISTRDLVAATLGNEGALTRVNAAMALTGESQEEVFARLKKTGDQFTEAGKKEYALVAAADELRKILGFQSGEIAKSTRKTQELSLASGKLFRALGGVKSRAKIVARVESQGFPQTLGQAVRLTRGLKLTPKQLRIAVKALGFPATSKQIEGVQRRMRDTGKQRADLGPFQTSLLAGLTGARRNVDRNAGQLKRLFQGSGRQRADMGPFVSSIRSGTQNAQQIAGEGGRGVGAALKSGVLGGVSGLMLALSGEVSAAVRAAIAAGRREARAKSPSRAMWELGRDLGDGLTLGLRQSAGRAAKAGKNIVTQILGSVVAGSAGIGKALDQLDKLIEKKTQEARGRRILKALRDEYKELRRNGAKQDANNRKLDAAIAKVKELRRAAQDYSNTIRDSIVAFGSLTAVGSGTGFGSLEQMLAQMRGRVEAAKRFAELIKQLQKAGLNKTSIQQLLDAGVEGGLGIAETIASGGAAAIKEINDLTKQLAGTGTSLGDSMAQAYHAAGIKAAQGIVDGLKEKERDLNAIARKLARELARQVRRALKIKSPSQVFRKLGQQTAQGLEIGLSDVHVKRAGSRLAGELVAGFGRPELTADALAAGRTTAPVQVAATVQLTAEQLTALERGRRIKLDLDAWNGTGARSPAP